MSEPSTGDAVSGPDIASKVFRKVRIDAPHRRFVCRRYLRVVTLAWCDCRVEAVGLVFPLADEVGAWVTGPGARFVLAETTPDFWAWFEAVALATTLPRDWYVRAERGESFAPSRRGQRQSTVLASVAPRNGKEGAT